MRFPSIRGFLVLTIILTGSRPAHGETSRYVLRDSTYRFISAYGPDTLVVRDITFPHPILAADVDSATGTLVVSTGDFWIKEAPAESRSIFRDETRDTRIIGYDLRKRKVTWTDGRRAYPMGLAPRRALLQKSENRQDLIRLPDGHQLADVIGNSFGWRDGLWLTVSDQNVSALDPEDGSVLWRVPRQVKGHLDDLIRRDSVFYLVAEGIEKVHASKGWVWAYPMRASRKNIYSAPGAGTIQEKSLFGGGPNRAVAMTSQPLIQDPDIFFAADTIVVRLDSRTGLAHWRRELHHAHGFSLKERALGYSWTPQFLGRLAIRDAGENISVASVGWASGPKSAYVADPPSFALLTKRDGKLLGRVEVPASGSSRTREAPRWVTFSWAKTASWRSTTNCV